MTLYTRNIIPVSEVYKLYPDIENKTLDAIRKLNSKKYLSTTSNIHHELQLKEVKPRHVYTIANKLTREGRLSMGMRQASCRKTMYFVSGGV